MKAGTLTTFEAAAFGDDPLAIVELRDRSWLDDPAIGERVKPGILSAGGALPADDACDRCTACRASSTRWRTSTCRTARRWSDSNWMANPADYGIEQSLGLMVNYLYDRGRIASNARAYLADGDIRVSSGVKGLIKSVKER